MKKKITIKDREKQNKAKTIVKWVFAGLGWSLLLACFIALLSLGVKGCNNKSNKTAEVSEIAPQQLAPKRAINGDKYEYIYINQFDLEDNSQSVYSSYLIDIANLLGYEEYYYTTPDTETIELYQMNIEGAYNTTTGFIEMFEAKIVLKSAYVQQTSNVWRYHYVLDNVVLYANGDSQGTFQRLGWVDSSHNETYVIFYSGGSRILMNEAPNVLDYIHIALLNPFYKGEVYAPVNYTFNEQINFNAPFGLTTQQAYYTGGDSTYTYSPGFFISGGEVFDLIKVTMGSADSSYFEISSNGGGTAYDMAPAGTKYYMYMEYLNSLTGVNHVVNSRDYGQVEKSGGIIRPALRSSHWRSQSYRYITLIDNVSESVITQISIFNNNSSNINNGTSGAGNIFGVFDLLTGAFGSWASIFSIQLIPGLTIGVFFFLPLVVGIIVLVFRAVKK